jgi:hypothetical protein
MRLEIVSIKDRGELERERIVIKVNAEDDVGKYALFCVKQNDKGLTNKIFGAYWFPDNPVEPGDLIVLYSKSGKRSNKKTKGGVTYFYYWWQKSPQWVDQNNAAVLLNCPDWKAFSPDEDEEAVEEPE